MKILLILGFIVLFYLFPILRYSVCHPVQVLRYAVVDLYEYIKYKKYNEFVEYGKMTMYIADDKQPFGSGKTLNLVRYVSGIYKQYNGKLVWDKDKQEFVPQEVKIYSNIKLLGIPFIPLVSEQQIIEASELGSSSTIHLFILDEMASQFNNRDWKKNLSEDLLNAILQQRKSKIAIIGTVQDYSLFDATLRKLCTSVFVCSKLWRFLTLKEYYAKDVERAQTNTDLIAIRSLFVRFATDSLYHSYDTSEKVSKIKKQIEEGALLSNEEILLAANGTPMELGSLTRINRKHRKRFRK